MEAEITWKHSKLHTNCDSLYVHMHIPHVAVEPKYKCRPSHLFWKVAHLLTHNIMTLISTSSLSHPVFFCVSLLILLLHLLLSFYSSLVRVWLRARAHVNTVVCTCRRAQQNSLLCFLPHAPHTQSARSHRCRPVSLLSVPVSAKLADTVDYSYCRRSTGPATICSCTCWWQALVFLLCKFVHPQKDKYDAALPPSLPLSLPLSQHIGKLLLNHPSSIS